MFYYVCRTLTPGNVLFWKIIFSWLCKAHAFSDAMLYAISHTLIHTLCLSKYAILPIKLSSDARNLQNFSIWIMLSILTCAVITLCEHQPVSTVFACMAKQRNWNFCVKFQQVFVTRYFNLWKSAVFICCCYECLVLRLRSSVKLIHNCPGSLQNSSKYFYIHQTCRYGKRYI